MLKFVEIDCFMLSIFRVQGQSMEPYIKEGSFVLTRGFFPWERPKKEEIVLARDPRNGRTLLKRVNRQEGANYWLEGDNKDASTDSRTFGTISSKNILGKVFLTV